MGRKRVSRELVVAMNGRRVGRLVRVSRGHLQFHYAADWLADPSAIPVSLSMPLSPSVYTGDSVFDFFDNLLPDNIGIRNRLQDVLGADSTRPFDLLECMGADCVGALQLYPESATPPDVHGIEAEPVDDAWIGESLRAYRTRPLGIVRAAPFRISIAGAQEKTALLWHDDCWQRPRLATPTSHIFKLPIGEAASGIDLADSVENEWLCLRLARAFGLTVPDAEIHEFDGQRALVVERFDRRWASDRSWLIRTPQEDVCQALGISPNKKYESHGGPGIAPILDLLLQSDDPQRDRRNFFRAVIVFWLLAAIDGHAKNFSVFLMAGGRSRSTPVYDILSAHPIVARGQLHRRQLRMAMAVHGKHRHYSWDKIQTRHWTLTARKARFAVSEVEDILNDCATRGPGILRDVQQELPPDFPDAVAEPIFQGVTETLGRI